MDGIRVGPKRFDRGEIRAGKSVRLRYFLPFDREIPALFQEAELLRPRCRFILVEVDTSLPGKRVVRVLDDILKRRPPPDRLLMDNGPEFIGRDLDEWAYRHGVKLGFIEAGKPTQNGFHESFHGKFRDECLNEHWFLSVADARRIAEEYLYDYNHVRPHSSLEYLTPDEFAAKEAARLSPLSPQGAEQGQAEGVDNHKVPVLSMPAGLSS